ncbi:MAG TPA: hemerythrin domain-containing protein [Rubrivivax sp.]|nr:hemerythrin domain-containing protein [Rubrivivax sp.]
MHILIPRRQAVIGAAAALSLLPLREAVAQTSARGGDWLAMVKAHHALVAKTFDAMLASGNTLFERRRRMQRTLAYQLTAHSVAEENVIYPALATAGLVSESDKLYLDQAHTKVMNAQLELSSLNEQGPWMEKVRVLQAAVLKHAKEDEEGTIFPKLHQQLDAQKNAVLTAAYAREFASVKPRPDAAAA